ncbi:LVIVD repeat-containing protein [Bacteroides sp. 519]|uniref:LVIVD repeat-containing protein n=1 Tax=Bacteroides sp. 519 TaxID=2302937 RepID=UPI0013D302BE|nr:hypothetical protein [Bacteroides sp. 519]NDV57441.1 hypothetical protein [Bacteroides sp. 519]
MKKVIYAMCAVLAGLLSACSDTVKEKVVYYINEPVFVSATELRSRSIVTQVPQEMEKQGKLCFYEGYLYISEPQKGIHIIDNRNPAAPQNVGFIELDGNVDIAIYNNKLYADHFIDLVYFDISNPAKPVYTGRLENAFKYALPIYDFTDIYDYNACYSEKNRDKIVVGWNRVRREETIYHYKDDMMAESPGGSSESAGINGSMSRFSTHKGYLYTVMNNMMSIIDISTDTPTKPVEDLYVGFEVETIFYYKDHMFLGTPTGMSIYSVENPIAPERMSTTWHINGCDPVVVENDIAYVTIHSGNFCGQNNNELIIYDVSDVKAPKMLVSYAMTKPKGIGIDNGILFICDDGLKIFDASDPLTLMAHQLAHYAGMEGYDLIPYNNVLMMIADDGLYQYDYTDVRKISQLSKIAISN